MMTQIESELLSMESCESKTIDGGIKAEANLFLTRWSRSSSVARCLDEHVSSRRTQSTTFSTAQTVYDSTFAEKPKQGAARGPWLQTKSFKVQGFKSSRLDLENNLRNHGE
jgi:hypothetical protein